MSLVKASDHFPVMTSLATAAERLLSR